MEHEILEKLKRGCEARGLIYDDIIYEDEIDNAIEVVNERSEDYVLNHREEYDYVTARAVSNLNGLIEICGGLVKKGGYFICLRGKDGLDEINKALDAIKTMGFVIDRTWEDRLFNGDKRIISYFLKNSKTPIKYPRKYYIIKKNPL